MNGMPEWEMIESGEFHPDDVMLRSVPRRWHVYEGKFRLKLYRCGVGGAVLRGRFTNLVGITGNRYY